MSYPDRQLPITPDASQRERQFGRYLMTRTKIGAGKFGQVYLGYDTVTGRKVAMKVVELRNQDDRNAIAEVFSLRKLRHDSIVQLLDQLKNDKFLVMVMELCEGGDLERCMRQRGGPLSEHVARRLFRELCLGLHALKGQSMLHRDLKPSNLFLTTDDPEAAHIKIGDLGFSKRTEDLAVSAIGTAYYMAPERLRGESYGFEAEVFAAGLILFEMLSGRKPFTARNQGELCACFEAGCDTLADIPNVSSDASDLVRRMLRVRPEERITVDELVQHPFVAEAPSSPPRELLPSSSTASTAAPSCEVSGSTPTSTASPHVGKQEGDGDFCLEDARERPVVGESGLRREEAVEGADTGVQGEPKQSPWPSSTLQKIVPGNAARAQPSPLPPPPPAPRHTRARSGQSHGGSFGSGPDAREGPGDSSSRTREGGGNLGDSYGGSFGGSFANTASLGNFSTVFHGASGPVAALVCARLVRDVAREEVEPARAAVLYAHCCRLLVDARRSSDDARILYKECFELAHHNKQVALVHRQQLEYQERLTSPSDDAGGGDSEAGGGAGGALRLEVLPAYALIAAHAARIAECAAREELLGRATCGAYNEPVRDVYGSALMLLEVADAECEASGNVEDPVEAAAARPVSRSVKELRERIRSHYDFLGNRAEHA